MFSADQCLAKAKELAERAPLSSIISSELLELAERWLDLAQIAERQDCLEGCPKSPAVEL